MSFYFYAEDELKIFLPRNELLGRDIFLGPKKCRHRQEILKKLQVNNSIEVCRVAKELHLL